MLSFFFLRGASSDFNLRRLVALRARTGFDYYYYYWQWLGSSGQITVGRVLGRAKCTHKYTVLHIGLAYIYVFTVRSIDDNAGYNETRKTVCLHCVKSLWRTDRGTRRTSLITVIYIYIYMNAYKVLTFKSRSRTVYVIVRWQSRSCEKHAKLYSCVSVAFDWLFPFSNYIYVFRVDFMQIKCIE